MAVVSYCILRLGSVLSCEYAGRSPESESLSRTKTSPFLLALRLLCDPQPADCSISWSPLSGRQPTLDSKCLRRVLTHKGRAVDYAVKIRVNAQQTGVDLNVKHSMVRPYVHPFEYVI